MASTAYLIPPPRTGSNSTSSVASSQPASSRTLPFPGFRTHSSSRVRPAAERSIESPVSGARHDFDDLFNRLLSELAIARRGLRVREDLKARMTYILQETQNNERADKELASALDDVVQTWSDREQEPQEDVMKELEQMSKLLRSTGIRKQVRVVSPESETSSIRSQAVHRPALKSNWGSSSASGSSSSLTAEHLAWGPPSPLPPVTQASAPDSQNVGWGISAAAGKGGGERLQSPPLTPQAASEAQIPTPDPNISADWNYISPLPHLPIPASAPPLGALTVKVQKLLDIRIFQEDKSHYVTDQLIVCANSAAYSASDNSRTLDRIIQLVFERAVESGLPTIWRYAELCSKMMNGTSESVELREPAPLYDPGKDYVAPRLAGPRLFRALLLSRCRYAFEKGQEKFDSRAEATVVIHNRKLGNRKFKPPTPSPYKVFMAKRRWCGLMRFIGELWRVGILTEAIVVQCGDKLMERAEKAEEDEVEAVGVFLMTVGKRLEARRKETMDEWFDKLKGMSEREEPRENLMLMDIMKRREEGWGPNDMSRRIWPTF